LLQGYHSHPFPTRFYSNKDYFFSKQLLAKNSGQSANGYATQIVGEVLEKLITVGIADPDASIRQVVLSSLNEGFDRYLAQAENVRSLFTALNDEVFEIRELSIAVIGRLTIHNPAYVLPSLRKTLIQLLTELEYSTVRLVFISLFFFFFFFWAKVKTSEISISFGFSVEVKRRPPCSSGT